MTKISVVATAAVFGCAGGTLDGTASHTITDSSGVQIVESHTPSWGEPGRAINPQPELRIGEIDGQGAYQFGRVSDAILLDENRMAVAETQAKEVRIFDANGSHIRSLGRPGQGPGEFGFLYRMWPYLGDSIIAFDPSLSRTSIFSLTDDGFRTIQNHLPGTHLLFGVLSKRLVFLTPGGVYRRLYPPNMTWDSTDIFMTDSVTGVWDVVHRLPIMRRRIAPDGQRLGMTLPPWAFQAVASDGFYWGISDRFEISFYDQTGTLIRSIRHALQPRPLNADLRAEYEVAYTEYAARYLTRPGMQPSVEFDDNGWAETAPLLQGAFVDRDQRLWVAHASWPLRDSLPPRWSIFSPDGTWLGDLTTPERLRILDSRGDLVLSVWTDDLDVPYVQLNRIVPAI